MEGIRHVARGRRLGERDARPAVGDGVRQRDAPVMAAVGDFALIGGRRAKGHRRSMADGTRNQHRKASKPPGDHRQTI